ncbi:MAG: homoserine dehydrogenase [Clostridia bacterium]|nr:homoserine dehydrogenase [Clostridia bacterium]
MVYIGILGYGVVGSGVAEVIRKNSSSIKVRAGEEIKVKKILDIRDFSDSPDKDVLTKNSDDIFSDDSISIVVETIGGARIAYDFTKKALQAGKSVVTSNKELVATHGPELLKLARENNVSYLFEASVGGGIPIIRPLNRCLAANEISGIIGILNGTTNYILTQMKRDGKNFAEALKEAQEKGYAEADPTADIEGHDACRKIAILSSIAYNEFVDYKDIYTEGITRISLEDMHYAEAMNSAIKLIGMSKRIDGKVFARVSPALVSKTSPLSNVEDVFNAIVVKGNAIGDAMFYGRGAGKLPTASAVVADVIDIVKHAEGTIGTTWVVKEESNTINKDEVETKFFIRVKTEDIKRTEISIGELFGNINRVKTGNISVEDEVAFVTGRIPEKRLAEIVNKLKDFEFVIDIANMIRVLDE